MTRNDRAVGTFQEARLPVQAKLAATWASFMFLYVYVDIFHIYLPGTVPDILDGRVFEFDISQTWAFSALALVAIPIFMIALSMTLPARINRRANIIVAAVYVVVSVFNAVGESWTYYFGFAIGLEVLLLAAIIRLAWMWPRTAQATVGRDLASARA